MVCVTITQPSKVNSKMYKGVESSSSLEKEDPVENTINPYISTQYLPIQNNLSKRKVSEPTFMLLAICKM